MPSPLVTPSDDVFLQTAQLRARYGGVSHMWVERRIAGDPEFPRPTYISRRRFWRLADLIAWERNKALAALPARQARPAPAVECAA